MPSVQLDPEVFNALKALAEPFVDTPNTVIRRLLKEKGVLAMPGAPVRPNAGEGKESQASNRRTVSQPVCEKFLLHALATKFKGGAHKNDVTAAVLDAMRTRDMLSESDFELVSSGESRVANTIAWGRNALKERGLIRGTSRRGFWELTEEGIKQGKGITL